MVVMPMVANAAFPKCGFGGRGWVASSSGPIYSSSGRVLFQEREETHKNEEKLNLTSSKRERLSLYNQIYREYYTYRYDSAMVYAKGACNWRNSCMMTITSTSTRSIGLRCYPQEASTVRLKTCCFLWSQKTFRPSWCNTIITPWHGCITIGELSAKGLNSRRKCKIKKTLSCQDPWIYGQQTICALLLSEWWVGVFATSHRQESAGLVSESTCRQPCWQQGACFCCILYSSLLSRQWANGHIWEIFGTGGHLRPGLSLERKFGTSGTFHLSI